MSLKTNQITSAYRRLLYKKNIAPINVITTTANCLYDDTLYGLSDKFITFIPQTLSGSAVDSSIMFINDPSAFVSRYSEFDTLTNKVLFFHDDRIIKMKKEDLFLFNNQITQYESYTFNKNVCQINNNIIPIEYGFKAPTNLSNKRKSIILLGNEQNIDIIMHNQIRQVYQDTELINAKELLGKDSSSILSQYKICITMNSRYNTLLAASNGCFVVSNIEESTIPYYIQANDFETIMNNIDNLLSKDASIHKEICDSITNQYSYSKFATTITTIVQNTCNKVIKL